MVARAVMRYAVAKMFKMVLSHCYVVAIVLWVVARAVKQLPKGFNFFYCFAM